MAPLYDNVRMCVNYSIKESENQINQQYPPAQTQKGLKKTIFTKIVEKNKQPVN